MRINDATGSWMIVATLTAALTATTTIQALRSYHDLTTGWSWDLAYYNQWYWSITRGDAVLSVQPIASYGVEGPSAWKSNYLSPARYLIIPLYAAIPDPRTLLVIQNVVYWWLIPAAFSLTLSECGSRRVALSATLLTALTPLAWPLAWNDFRELSMGLPFVLWAYQGVRSRRAGPATAGVAGMLACRQEFAVIVAALAFLPPREDEDVGRKAQWRLALFNVGLGWALLFFLYLYLVVGRLAPEQYVDQFLAPKPSLRETLATLTPILRDGLGPWTVLAWIVPGAGLLAAPWVWSLSSGQWAMRFLTGPAWHHVRYAVPTVATAMAAGLIGYARLAVRLRGRRGAALILAAVWLGAASWSAFGLRATLRLMEQIPRPVDADDVEPFWSWAARVEPDDAVLAAYEFSAPLSSRKALYSYIMRINEPRGYPTLRPEFRWIFWKLPGGDVGRFEAQGFAVVHRGPSMMVLHRP